MKKYINAEAMQHAMKLLQMGAKVQQIDSKMCYIEFCIEGYKIGYVYNINAKGKYFLERIKPYPLPLRVFNNEKDVIDIIEIDVNQYKNAIKSKNIDEFLEISSKIDVSLRKFEDLYLYYNVPKENADKLLDLIKQFDEVIKETQKTAERVSFEKEPFNLE